MSSEERISCIGQRSHEKNRYKIFESLDRRSFPGPSAAGIRQRMLRTSYGPAQYPCQHQTYANLAQQRRSQKKIKTRAHTKKQETTHLGRSLDRGGKVSCTHGLLPDRSGRTGMHRMTNAGPETEMELWAVGRLRDPFFFVHLIFFFGIVFFFFASSRNFV